MSEKKPASSLGLQLGNLPPATVDAMFAGLSWEAEKVHGPAVRSAIAAVFASATVEADVMSDCDASPRDRLAAAKQFKQGFIEACKLVSAPPTARVATVVVDDTRESVSVALGSLYGDEG